MFAKRIQDETCFKEYKSANVQKCIVIIIVIIVLYYCIVIIVLLYCDYYYW